MDLLIIDNENELARPIGNVQGVSVTVYDDEVRALNAIERVKPDIIILNYSVQHSHTAEFISLLCRVSEHSKIVLIARALTDDEILDCLIAGAKGYLQLNDMPGFINKLLPAVQAGEAWITRRMVAKLIDKLLHQQIEHSVSP